MTPRFRAILVVGVTLGLVGWWAGYPEVTALGAASVTLPLVCLLTVGRRPRGSLALRTRDLLVRRGDPCVVELYLTLDKKRRGLRIVEGDLRSPSVTTPVAHVAATTVPIAISTGVRCRRPLGPFACVQGDPWSLVRRVCLISEPGWLTVLPRSLPVRADLLPGLSHGAGEAMSRRRGEDHFFALRDYVLGDEPRNVHWRSSARSGRLVVKQRVAALADGTMVVLDVDASAYAVGNEFDRVFHETRFEAAVEVAASLVDDRLDRGERVMFFSTGLDREEVRKLSTGKAAISVALAEVASRSGVECQPERLGALVTQTRCSRVLVVTGSPDNSLLDAVRGLRREADATLVCVGDGPAPGGTGVATIIVSGAEALA